MLHGPRMFVCRQRHDDFLGRVGTFVLALKRCVYTELSDESIMWLKGGLTSGVEGDQGPECVFIQHVHPPEAPPLIVRGWASASVMQDRHLGYGAGGSAHTHTHTPLPVPQFHSDVFCLVLFVSRWGLPFKTRPPQLPEGSITDRGGEQECILMKCQPD